MGFKKGISDNKVKGVIVRVNLVVFGFALHLLSVLHVDTLNH